MREIRRRIRIVGAFPDGQSCLNLAATRLRYIAGPAWSAKCHMNLLHTLPDGGPSAPRMRRHRQGTSACR